jgi:type IV pilus assembly protein PilA
MRNIQNILEAKKRERAESGESGFSLIELIVVVVILGILAAIAIPIFLGIQTNAKTNSLKAIAANAASAVAADLAQTAPVSVGGATVPTSIYKVDPSTGVTVTITKPTTGTPTIDGYCVSAATGTGSLTGATSPQTAGPGC